MQDDKHTNCALAINNRGRVSPPLSQEYFGNSAELIVVSVRGGELLWQSLGWVAMLLNEVVVSHNDKKVRDRTKRWMKNRRIYQIGRCLDPYNVVFGNSPRFDVYGAEFGMGKALAVVNGQGNKFDGKVMSAPGRDEEGIVDMDEEFLECELINALGRLRLHV